MGHPVRCRQRTDAGPGGRPPSSGRRAPLGAVPRLLKSRRHHRIRPKELRTMIILYRPLFFLGLLGAAVGVFFGVKGMLVAQEAVSEVNRKGGDAASMFRAERLDSALDKVRAKVGDDGKLLQLNIYPGYLDVNASTGSEDEGRAFKVQGDGRIIEHPLTLTGPGRLE